MNHAQSLETMFDAMAWAGAGALLAAYARTALGAPGPREALAWRWANCLGAAALFGASAIHGAWPAAALNAAWALIGAGSLIGDPRRWLRRSGRAVD